MLIVLIMILFLVFSINMILTKRDYVHPSNIFSGLFLLSSLFCALVSNKYAITFNEITVIVISCPLIIMTIMTVIFSINKNTSVHSNQKLEYISVHKLISVSIICIQILSIYLFIQYIQNISLALGRDGGVAEYIYTHDYLVKFDNDKLRSLNIDRPFVFSLINVPSEVVGYIYVYILVHNFIITRKVSLICVLVVFLLLIKLLLTGSRSPIFRVITMIFILYHILYYYHNSIDIRKLRFLTLIKFIVYSLPLATFFTLLLSAMGRNSGDTEIVEYLFLYIGAPLLNLNNYLANHPTIGLLNDFELFAEQTLRGGYYFLYELSGNEKYLVTSIVGQDSFVTSDNGLFLGNVFTTFYMFIHDLGIFGVLFFSAIMFFYYISMHSRFFIRKKKISKGIDMSIFLYSYLFNDLIMLFFSNRFYETVFNIGFVKFIIYFYIIKSLMFIKLKIRA